jgi:N-acetylmuramoyl-L-alanine amidase
MVKRGIGQAVARVMRCVLLAAAFASPLSASADEVIKPLELREFALAGDSLKTRMLFHLNSEAQPKLTLLRGPHRLVIDLPSARFRFDADALKPRGLITDIRYGALEAGSSRIIVTAKGPFKLTDFDLVPNEEQAAKASHRLVFDLEATSEDAFDAALAEQTVTTASTPAAGAAGSPLRAVTAAPANKRFTVVVDPGHGGIDGGANGVSGTVEKEVTLAFAQELRDQLAKAGDIEVHLTRDGDQFLRLDERVRIAREHAADLFISIHADTIRLKGIRGATIYTVSDRASDAESALLAIRENLSDELAGIEVPDEDHQVADILVDLIRRETHAFSMGFARVLVQELRDTVTLINNPHRFAGFRVLRAPDVPSVLLELGYLSNESDEKQLRDPKWHARAASGIVDAVRQFAGPRLGGG